MRFLGANSQKKRGEPLGVAAQEKVATFVPKNRSNFNSLVNETQTNLYNNMNTIYSKIYTSLPDNFNTFFATHTRHSIFHSLMRARPRLRSRFASARASPLLRRYPFSIARVRSARRLLPRELAHACLLRRARSISPHVFFVCARPRVRSTRRPLPLALARARSSSRADSLAARPLCLRSPRVRILGVRLRFA